MGAWATSLLPDVIIPCLMGPGLKRGRWRGATVVGICHDAGSYVLVIFVNSKDRDPKEVISKAPSLRESIAFSAVRFVCEIQLSCQSNCCSSLLDTLVCIGSRLSDSQLVFAASRTGRCGAALRRLAQQTNFTLGKRLLRRFSKQKNSRLLQSKRRRPFSLFRCKGF